MMIVLEALALYTIGTLAGALIVGVIMGVL